MQIIRSPQEYDVCIVGSGAGGGMAAYMLTAAGANCVMLEAGPMWDTADDGFMFKWPYDSPRRGASTDAQQFGEFDAGLGGWSLDGEPYTVASGQSFRWFRTRMLGGRTNHWGRISLRYGPDDFRRRSLDGLGDDWPISYDDIAPYYDRIDRLIGIFGSREGLPNDPDGIFMDPPEPRCWEKMIKQGADQMGITCIPSRLSIITRAINGRSQCHYCGQCSRGCATRSNFSSPTVLLPPALDTGRLEIIDNAMAREVTVDGDGNARGVSYVNKNDGREYEVRARVVVLAASACSTARLLLNSKSALSPDGLANNTGNVGRYLSDNTGTDVAGFVPRLVDNVPHNEDGVGGAHLFMPWWLNNRELDFPRGYHIEIWGGRGMPGYGFMGGIHRLPPGGGYGAQLKEDYRRYYGSIIGFSGRGEMIPNENSYCEIDPDTVDRWGIPVLRFHFQWTDAELLQVKHMQETFRELIETLGGTPMGNMPSREQGYGITQGGQIIHEIGVTRMGADPATSVLNSHCQAHDVDNLFVTDGGPFVTNGDKNPTWTILALAMRTSEYIIEQRNQGAI
ncbi:MAG: GMC family oxidoreductase [Acidobacteriota bacterium]|jgi:choline dehydrogenase-like flavoprotein